MRSNKANISMLAPACVLLISLGVIVPAVNAQTAGNESAVCYRVTGLPSVGMVTTSEDPPTEVRTGDTFDMPQALVYIAPGASGEFYLTYDVSNVVDGLCLTAPVLDSATITFNIVDADDCTPKGRDLDCGPLN